MIVILIENIQFFFDSVHNDPNFITFFEQNSTLPPQKDKKIPPFKFWNPCLIPPDLASKSHTNIFL